MDQEREAPNWGISPIPYATPPEERRRSIRRLYVRPRNTARKVIINETGGKRKCSVLCKISIAVLIVAALSALVSVPSAKQIYQELKHHYHQAHEQLSRETSSRCAKRSANFTPILQAIEQSVIGQPHLAGELGEWFRVDWQRSFHCALFAGGTGVGKSLTASIVAKHYPYPANVHYVVGQEFTNEKKRYAAFKATLFNIQRAATTNSHCAHYLLLTDHLSLHDIGFVTKVSNRLREVSRQHRLNLHALFVLRTAGQPDLGNLAATIPEARLVEFKPIGPSELEECVRREAATMGIDLHGDRALVPLVVNQINATRHGCKPVRAKLIPFSLKFAERQVEIASNQD